MVNSDQDIEDLVRLRHTVQHAKRLTFDLSEFGRHTALIALDGACEFAMRLCIAARQIDVGRNNDKFHNLVAALDRDLGDAWSPPRRRELLAMHSARNRAQHGGELPDPPLMATWRDAAAVHIGTLVLAVYEVDLDGVLLASAVRDADLRSQMTAVERALEAGDPSSALDRSMSLLETVRLRWREQQQDAYGWMALPERSRAGEDYSDATSRAADYAEVGVFADDLGEYHWLLAVDRHARQGIALQEADARRAALFVYHWLLRWQHFDANYPQDSWRAAFSEMAPPTTGEGDPPHITRYRYAGSMELAGRVLRRVDVTVANIPERGRGTWGEDAAAALSEVAARNGLTASDNAAFGDVMQSETDAVAGRYAFLFSRDLTASQVKAILAGTVDECTRRYAERHEITEAKVRSQQALISQISTALGDDSLGLFGQPTLDPRVERTGDVSLSVVPFKGTDEELWHTAAIMRGIGSTLAAAGLENGNITVQAGDLVQQQQALREALARCQAKISDLRTRAAVQAEEDAVFAAEFDESPPGH
jgi:hypothetical protein